MHTAESACALSTRGLRGEVPALSVGARCEDKMADETKPVTGPVPKPRPRKSTLSVSTESVETSSPVAASRRRSATSESSECGKLFTLLFNVSHSVMLCG